MWLARVPNARIHIHGHHETENHETENHETEYHGITMTIAPTSYWQESTRPISSLALITPLLVFYEAGVLLMGPQAIRNGVDLWLRDFLVVIGLGNYFVLPTLTCVILVAWHHLKRDQWKISHQVLGGMMLESVACAMLLVALAHLHGKWFLSTGAAAESFAARAVGYCGAGIYEELLFRLMLLPTVGLACRAVGMSWKHAWMLGIVLTSLAFSAAHYQAFTGAGYDFQWHSFTFRFAAGLFFAVLFVFRGFGIAATAHAFYDILVEAL